QNETLYAVDPDYQPVFFYVKAPLQYVSHVENLPRNGRYFLVRKENEAEALATQEWAPLRAQPIARVHDYSKREMVLFKVPSANKDLQIGRLELVSMLTNFVWRNYVRWRNDRNFRPAAPWHGPCMATKTGPTTQADGIEPGEMAHADAFVTRGRRAH